MPNFKDYKISKSGNHFWIETAVTINEETGEITYTDYRPIPVTPERMELWKKLRGA